MTAIILNTVFLLSYSRTFSMPLDELLSSYPSSGTSSAPPCLPPSLKDSSTTDCNGGCSSESTYVLDKGQSAAAAVLDAFNASYVAAYR